MLSAILPALLILSPRAAEAFCGFYVAQADTELFNEASKVVMVRDGNRTVLTMANDFQGDVKDFAIVIPVPTVLEEGQINIADPGIIDHLDRYTAPRLVEYHDPDPCAPRYLEDRMVMSAMPEVDGAVGRGAASAKSLGVTIEAEYAVGEYDIQILSAEQSDGLLVWLNQEGYRLPAGAEEILGSYIRDELKFFVAKVNLAELAASDYQMLRPLSVAYESPRFTLPIRLGTLNAKGEQELFVFAITRNGRVETTNYRTVKLPSNVDVPIFVRDEFGEFYKAMFNQQVAEKGAATTFLEYAWDMNWCDPCAADPLSVAQLRELGVFWLADQPFTQPMPRRGMIAPQAVNAFVTRLHLRYTDETHPQDLEFQITGDRQNWQGRYILRHPFTGEATCEAAEGYYTQLHDRFEKEARTLAELTGWQIADIRQSMAENGQNPADFKAGAPQPWWRRMWSD